VSTDYPDVIPMLAYEDGPAAMEWLARAFGFNELARIVTPDGRLSHGEMQAGAGMIMMASPTPDYQSPAHHRTTCEAAKAWQSVPYIVDGVLVYVEDVAAHCDTARHAGATILSEPERDEHGTKYRAEDCEGHRWMFVQR
jgi:uncharacterized glyoxalase superfamily protein PhnB